MLETMHHVTNKYCNTYDHSITNKYCNTYDHSITNNPMTGL